MKEELQMFLSSSDSHYTPEPPHPPAFSLSSFFLPAFYMAKELKWKTTGFSK